MRSKIFIPAIGIAAALVFSACSQLDVVGKVSVTSFDSVIQKAKVEKDDMYGGWSLSAPDNTARFIFSNDFAVSAPHDVMLETDLKPFVNAGLDVSKLPAGMVIGDKIMVGQSLGDNKFSGDAQSTPIASFKELVREKRDVIGYHEKLDHYGVDLGNGNKFEWAKDMSKNDKDIVFVLDPKLFIDAGVDPAKVTGWAYAKVEIKDNSGKTLQVDKFLKPFNLE